MNVLLDTHFLLWTVLDSGRLEEFPWLDAYRPWGISPVSFLEIQFLAGRYHRVSAIDVVPPRMRSSAAASAPPPATAHNRSDRYWRVVGISVW